MVQLYMGGDSGGGRDTVSRYVFGTPSLPSGFSSDYWRTRALQDALASRGTPSASKSTGGGSSPVATPKSTSSPASAPKPAPALKPAPAPPLTGYAKHVAGFGGTEAYAEAIKAAEASGRPLSDPQSAAAFKAAHPELFATASPSVPPSAPAPPRTPEPSPPTPPAGGSPPAGGLPTFSLPGLPSLPAPPSPPPPVELEGPPNIEVPQAPEVPAPLTRQDVLGRGPGGFYEQAPVLQNFPTPDELYDLYKRTTGEESEGVRQFLASPEFTSVLGGRAPLWMQADPVWRLYLQRLGYLGPQQNMVMTPQTSIRKRTLEERLKRGRPTGQNL